ncbi:hypothetical protein [Terrabacter carboxydivorans]|uniref:DUF2892 domain-containing protein n=1 Tax=Terrabacter carboxydivorans TaxID=619730 RepID=A0ABN3KZT8_9MICO
MLSPRNLIIAGVVLIAISLGPSGHGLWWLVGFLWFLPRAVGRGHTCGRGTRRHHDRRHDLRGDQRGSQRDEPTGPSQPDPTRDRHEAFPAR